jgi:hypothetical protein
MPDYPHRGPNVSRIRLEGAGGFIYALTPVLILLFGAPLVLAGAIAAGAIIAPAIYWRTHGHPQSVTSLAGGASGFVLGMGLAIVLVAHPTFRVVALSCVAGGMLAAGALHWRSMRMAHPSIRDHAE